MMCFVLERQAEGTKVVEKDWCQIKTGNSMPQEWTGGRRKHTVNAWGAYVMEE